jgi:hypothetical protein
MVRVGVVTCQILELEFAYLFAHDQNVSEVWILENEYSLHLAQSLEAYQTRKIRKIRHPEEFRPGSKTGVAALIQVNQVGLHSHIPKLQETCLDAVRNISPFVDSVFLGYGLCGNAFKDIEEMFRDTPVPVLISMDRDGPVDDCIGLIIGGRENYYAEQCRCAGTMFMNAGFSKYSEDLLSEDLPERLRHKKGDILKRLMRGYKRCLLLPTPVMSKEQLEENSKAFATKYGLFIESRNGTLDLLKKGWERAVTAVK